MRAIYDLPAPAKLNLFLHITGRRADGYHLLQSAFVLVDWCDTLHVELRTDGQLSREDLGEPLPADDLVLRAARILQAESGIRAGAHIAIDKRIPSEAGLGGGSSDAATVLLALDRLWRLSLPLSRLAQIGVRLGADVPFFLRGDNAWVEGIGERITPLELPTARFIVVKPRAGLSTRLVFADPAVNRETPAAIIAGFAANPYGFGRNDLQDAAERICPEITQAVRWLESLGLSGRMTGSGSAVFALLPTSGGVFDAKPPQDGWRVRECSKMESHPLAGWASRDD